MPYTTQQRAIINMSLGLTRRDPPAVRQALLMAGLVESSLRQLNRGDRDSLGFLQQRPSQGWGPYKPGLAGARTDAQQFLQRARRNYAQGIRQPGRLAQSVQRSAFPERYGQKKGQVQEILRNKPRFIGNGAMSQTGPYQMAKQRQGRPGIPFRAELPYMQLLAQQLGVPFAGPIQGVIRPPQPRQRSLPRPRQQLPGTARMASRYGGAAPKAARSTLPWLIPFAKQFGVQITSTNEGNPGDGVHTKTSNHYLSRAVDVVGSEEQMRQIANYVRANPRQFREFFWDKAGFWVKNGRIYKGSIGGHKHVHLAR
jgi:hypothetical protein